jgi:histidine triad (HIT) family protein
MRLGHATDDCPFCAIVGGERDQPIVFADTSVTAFMCEPPATRGHVLVVPREHVTDFWEANDEQVIRTMTVAHRVAAALRRALEPDGLNIRSNSGARAGQDVFHFHVHLVPRYDDDTVLPGCVWGMPPWQPPPGGPAERERVAALIRAALDRGEA